MAFTLVINPGSSSKKFALFRDKICILDAYVERSDEGFEMCSVVGGVQQKCSLLDKKEYKNSLHSFLLICEQSEYKVSAEEITHVALRVVAPGTYFERHQVITPEFKKKLETVSVLAPLHIPHILQEILVVEKFLPKAVVYGISDSAFHSSKPEVARRYSIPLADAKELDLFRFGYHGLSVSSVIRRSISVTGKKAKNVIVCHIGSGVSVTAVCDGKSIDTTMGYAPGSGLVMGSRAGDMDAGALLSLMQQRHLKSNDAQVYLQSSGGLKGFAGEADLRLLLERRAHSDDDAVLAINSFIYHLQKSIGAYIAIMGGVDMILLTATASERSPVLRYLLLGSLKELGIDSSANNRSR